jgi:UDP-N-acetylmuramyl tripeptide synthase
LVHHEAADGDLQTVKVRLGLPGRINLANGAVALAVAAELGVDPERAAAGMAAVREVDGRYRRSRVGHHSVRLLLVKNPAGWLEALELLDATRPLLVVVNAREADGRDVSWLWDLPVESLRGRCIAVAGDRAADLGVRLSYDDVDHLTEPDPMRALELLPAGEVDVVATYTAFTALREELLHAESSTPAGSEEQGS